MDKKIFAPVAEELAAVESKLLMLLASPVYTVHAMNESLIRAGGKRLRPALYLLCAKTDTSREQAEKTSVAAALELIHMATLVHDDILDHAVMRRGLPAAHTIWGRHSAVLTGDYLFAKAFFILSQAVDRKLPQGHQLLPLLTDAVCAMCEGEILQREAAFDVLMNEERYLHITARKTAHFMSIACEMGASSADCDRRCAAALKRYGYYLGMAFQILDDIFDVTAAAKTIGKPAMHDLTQGNITLPVIYALQDDDSTILREIIQSRNFSEDSLKLCQENILKAGGVQYSSQAAAKYLQAACDSIPEEIPAQIQNALRSLACCLTAKAAV